MSFPPLTHCRSVAGSHVHLGRWLALVSQMEEAVLLLSGGGLQQAPVLPPRDMGGHSLGPPLWGCCCCLSAAPCSAQGDPYKGRPVGLRGLLCGGESSGFRSALLLHGLPAEDSAVQGCGERAACILSLLALPKGPGQLGGLEPSHMLFQHKVTVAPRRSRFYCFPIGLQETRHHGGGAESPSRPQ